MIELFRSLDLETVSICNRKCLTCIRNSHPNKEAVKPWFEEAYLPMDVIQEALDQCRELGFNGRVCLSHYNEPLYDERLPLIAELSKIKGFYTYFHTNGDFMDEQWAEEFDECVDEIRITLYMNEPRKTKRADWIQSLFKKTKLTFLIDQHVSTHFSPGFDTESLIEKHIGLPCTNEVTAHCIINHRRQFLLCCEDVIGNFDLGYFPETSISDYWFGEKHTKIVKDLKEYGGRKEYAYCSICPRA